MDGTRSGTGIILLTSLAFLKSRYPRFHLCRSCARQWWKALQLTGTNRIELYTEGYARAFVSGNALEAVTPYVKAANLARELKLGINAGHDLDLTNLKYFKQHIPFLDEVSIGHALVCDAIYLGFENTVQLYKRQLA